MKRLGGAALILVVLLGLLGCSQATKDRWLRTLFDDPPSSAETPVPVAEEPQAEVTTTTKAGAGWVHAPYAAGDCSACHFLRSSRTYYRGSPGRDGTVTAGSVRQASTRLQAPLQELCLRCHDDFAPAAQEAAGRWVHAPVASGECVFCHDPHRSGGRYLLEASSPAEICSRCHDAGNLNGIPAHEGTADSDCTTCHVPHAAAGEDLLREVRP